jgi:hypothetical protein
MLTLLKELCFDNNEAKSIISTLISFILVGLTSCSIKSLSFLCYIGNLINFAP